MHKFHLLSTLLFLSVSFTLYSQEQKEEEETSPQRLAIEGFYDSEELLTSSKAYHEKLFDYVNPFDPEGLLQRAIDKLESDFVDEALEDLEEAIDLYPRYGGAHFIKGIALEEKGKKELAKRCYEKALDYNPILTAAYNQLGCLYAIEEEMDSARQVFELAIARTPGYSLLHYNLGIVELYDEDFRKAIRHLEEAVNRDDCFIKAHAALILAHSEQGNRRRALLEIERAMLCEKDVPTLYALKGLLQFLAGKLNVALDELNTAIAMEPNYRYAHFLRSLVLIEKREYEPAVKELKVTFQIEASDLDSSLMWKHDESFGAALKYYEADSRNFSKKVNRRIERGICNFFIGHNRAAITNFEQAQTWAWQKCMSCYYFEGIALEERDLTKLAEKRYSKAIEMAPEIYELYQRRGAVRFRDSIWVPALEDYTTLLKMRPDIKEPHKDRGIIHMQLKKYNLAILDYNTFLEQGDTVDMQVLYDRALCYKEIKYYDNAIKDLTQVLEKQDKDLEAYYERAHCYYMNKNLEQSKIDLDTVLLTNSYYPKAHNLRGVILMDEGNYTGAIYHFNQAVIQQAAYKEALFNRYLAYRALEKYEKALHCLGELIDLDAKEGLYYFHRGYVKKQLEMGSACKDVKKALALGLKVEQEAIDEVCSK
ncbi:MAG: tetratricopeptide repeat protein [Saprospiraceae bacterium]|nr:tetratricopeptide repeat protein [Saprospiraceae bacterium]